jgi:hypothetical protein
VPVAQPLASISNESAGICHRKNAGACRGRALSQSVRCKAGWNILQTWLYLIVNDKLGALHEEVDMSDYLVKETIDFAEKILFAFSQPSGKSRAPVQLALYRGMFFLSLETISAAIRVLNSSKGSAQESGDALRDFLLIIRREVGAVAIDENSINGMWRSIINIPEAERHGESE